MTRRTRMLAGLGRLAVALVVAAALVGGLGVVSAVSRPEAAPVAGPPPAASVLPAEVSPGSVAPPLDPPPQEGEGVDPIRSWADEVSAEVDVPARALVAYANADLTMRTHQPTCHISWATLAGIGRIESDHGRYGGAMLREDGRPSTPIIGVPLDGTPGVRAIPDTDGGALDGDPRHDRAVGPMQFIPSTWRKWATDGNGDGLGDPQNIDDVAISAARYLCVGGRDMSSGPGWWNGVLSYNNSVDYARKVFALAERYAEAGNRRR